MRKWMGIAGLQVPPFDYWYNHWANIHMYINIIFIDFDCRVNKYIFQFGFALPVVLMSCLYCSCIPLKSKRLMNIMAFIRNYFSFRQKNGKTEKLSLPIGIRLNSFIGFQAEKAQLIMHAIKVFLIYPFEKSVHLFHDGEEVERCKRCPGRDLRHLIHMHVEEDERSSSQLTTYDNKFHFKF